MLVAERAPAALFVMSLAQQYFTSVAQSAQDQTVSTMSATIMDAMVLDAVKAVHRVAAGDALGAEVAAMTVVSKAIEVLTSTLGLGSPELLYRVVSQHLDYRPQQLPK